MMKKIVIIFLLTISGIAFGQSDNPYVYDESQMSTMADGDNPAGPGDPKLAPIDDYIPALLIVAIIFTFAYAKRKNVAAE